MIKMFLLMLCGINREQYDNIFTVLKNDYRDIYHRFLTIF